MTLADWLAGRQSASLYVTPRPVIGQHPAPTLRRQAFSCYRPALGRAGRAGGGVERAFSPLESWLSFTQVTQKSIDRGGRVEATDIPASRQRPPILLARRGCEVVRCGVAEHQGEGGGAAAAGAGHCCSTESAPLAHLHSRQSVSSLASRHYHARHHDPPSRALMISADIVSLDLAAANKATAITAMNINVSPNPLGTVYATKRRRRSNKR